MDLDINFRVFDGFFMYLGSEIYQEMLAKALAHYYGAKLLIFDSHSFLRVR